MEQLIKKSTLRKTCHRLGYRLSAKNADALRKELSFLIEKRLEQIMRSAKITGRKTIRPEHWK